MISMRMILEPRRRTPLFCSRTPPCRGAETGRRVSSITPICGLWRNPRSAGRSPSPELRRKPALYRDVDASLLGELKPHEGRGRWSSRGQAEAVGCELGMILIANSLLQLPVLTGFWGWWRNDETFNQLAIPWGTGMVNSFIIMELDSLKSGRPEKVAERGGSLPAVLIARKTVCLVCVSGYLDPFIGQQFVALIYHPRICLFLCPPGLQAPCWFGWRWLALFQRVGSRRLTHCSLIVGPAGVRRHDQMPSWGGEWKTALTLSIWWNLPEAGQCPLARGLSFTVPSWSVCLGTTKFCTILGKEIFLWQEPTKWMYYAVIW